MPSGSTRRPASKHLSSREKVRAHRKRLRARIAAHPTLATRHTHSDV